MRDYLIKTAEKKHISFHMPGHKGSGIYRHYGYEDFLDNLVDCDITEIPGADNLHQPEGIIRETERRYSRLYEADRSFLLINGTSCGILASVLATVRPGGKLVMSRGCHKSVYNAMQLGGITPIYVQPQKMGNISSSEIMGPVSAKDIAIALDSNPDAESVILPSPNYYGICSDIEKIAEEVHKRGKILIVDQAHGAHLKFFHKYGAGEGMPLPAEEQGADIVINSIHKTLASFTQSAVLNLCGQRVDAEKLKHMLSAVQSTSPSYILMASLDINSRIVEEHGPELFTNWKKNIDEFYLKTESLEKVDVLRLDGMDLSKINIDMSSLGISGNRLNQELMKRNIIPELVAGNLVMAMSGIGNVKEDYDRLYDALEEICLQRVKLADIQPEFFVDSNPVGKYESGIFDSLPKTAAPGNRIIEMNLSGAEGKVCASAVIPYPPGIPILCPGEKITDEIIRYLMKISGEGRTVLGLSGEGRICVFEYELNNSSD